MIKENEVLRISINPPERQYLLSCKSQVTCVCRKFGGIVPDNKTTEQIVSDMSDFEIDYVVSISMGSTSDSEIRVKYEYEDPEEESEA